MINKPIPSHLEAYLKLDQQFNWHPCSQMKDYELFKPLFVVGAQHNRIHLSNGQQIIDAISSWWCKSLGHQHPQLKKALQEQCDRFEHVIFANTTHETIIDLSQKLIQLFPSLQKVFYASEGSSAVEIAMKMSLHDRYIRGEQHKNKFIALENAYHGETLGALSVSDLGIYRQPYASVLLDTQYIPHLPYVSHIYEPLWDNCAEHWLFIEKFLEKNKEGVTAIIVEPIVQGAAGMKIYSQDFLRRLQHWAKAHNIHLIADEIMTGIGRTGKMFASEYADFRPDFLCLSKGLTAGWLPFSAALTTDAIYETFYGDYHPEKTFLHSHTYSGNPLAARIALEVLRIFENEPILEDVQLLGNTMFAALQEVAVVTGKLNNVRGIGAIVAADLVCEDNSRRLGYEIFQAAVQLGALLRPLGNTLYWLPPLNTSQQDIQLLKEITIQAIAAVQW